MVKHMGEMGFDLPDRQLACAYLDSDRGRDYLAAMACAANYAWANRQLLTHITRKTFESFFNKSRRELGMNLVYDVAHNIAKIENHIVDGKAMRLCVHRKGATRAFPPGHPELPDEYRKTGQPVIIPGDMGRESYLLKGTQKAMELSFGSTCHGAGRLMSRHEAIRRASRRSIAREMEQAGIFVMSAGRETLAEEASFAYKDVSKVVDVVHSIGVSVKVARMKPLVVVKG
jgi:tRNA-splicing ligase RtcB